MNIKRWIGRREANWKQLDTLLQQVEKRGIKSLPASQIKELASLYRSVSADLARARTNQVGHTLVKDLQRLTSRGYNQIYQGSRRQDWQGLGEFCRWGFPAVVQQTWSYIAIATAVFLLGALIAWWLAWQDPVFISLVVPEQLIEQVRDRQELWMGSILGMKPLASSSIMINNISVCFRAVAGGITCGAFTLYVMAFNGILIGAIGTLVGQNNLAYPFWAFVFPHGSLELPAIFFAGGAGLLIGRAILFPGQYRRVDALKFYGSQAAQLMFGIVPMLIIAGIIEGFLSPSPLVPSFLKYLVGIGLFSLLVIYCSSRKVEDTSK
ncbi:MAG: stage II sporulation protein M [Moorea sp. SIO3I7]|uniref:stage II sporulation protein M n=1 Tax=unclassified Moorena TaxID=2683338 RepID=UPI0013C1E271|nr:MULTISPECIES: stage II sporulation protein M [unclassified Moorena]NEN96351.1 stage II sporulation protein M [Moorena sp. SIO3I7]NEO06226.1 stage II sporulation protein M [Moorena sp. SIO3I8]NEO19321.1 stage II sporulation protein M [Moorena sp. SIO4A5]NEP20558.1 stage II sporulation protein M [Moorena sp. SIO3I6]